jgi:hypothetical protein
MHQHDKDEDTGTMRQLGMRSTTRMRVQECTSMTKMRVQQIMRQLGMRGSRSVGAIMTVVGVTAGRSN